MSFLGRLGVVAACPSPRRHDPRHRAAMVGGELAAKSQTNNRYRRRLREVERKSLVLFPSPETLTWHVLWSWSATEQPLPPPCLLWCSRCLSSAAGECAGEGGIRHGVSRRRRARHRQEPADQLVGCRGQRDRTALLTGPLLSMAGGRGEPSKKRVLSFFDFSENIKMCSFL